VGERDGWPRPPVFVVDRRAVFRRNRAHGVVPQNGHRVMCGVRVVASTASNAYANGGSRRHEQLPQIPEPSLRGRVIATTGCQSVQLSWVDVDIVANSFNGFPVPTTDDFAVFLRAIGASGPGVAHPTPNGRVPRSLSHRQAVRHQSEATTGVRSARPRTSASTLSTSPTRRDDPRTYATRVVPRGDHYLTSAEYAVMFLLRRKYHDRVSRTRYETRSLGL